MKPQSPWQVQQLCTRSTRSQEHQQGLCQPASEREAWHSSLATECKSGALQGPLWQQEEPAVYQVCAPVHINILAGTSILAQQVDYALLLLFKQSYILQYSMLHNFRTFKILQNLNLHICYKSTAVLPYWANRLVQWTHTFLFWWISLLCIVEKVAVKGSLMNRAALFSLPCIDQLYYEFMYIR